MKKRYLIITIIMMCMLLMPRVNASGAITQYSCLSGSVPVACSGTLTKGAELVGDNTEAEHFIVMKEDNGIYYLMTKYLLESDGGTGYKQTASTTTGATYAWGTSITINKDDDNSTTLSGDVASSYISSLTKGTAVNDRSTTGLNGIPSVTLICEYTGTCGTVTNEGITVSPYTTIVTSNGLTGDILLGDSTWTNPPYGYWTSSAGDDGFLWDVDARGYFGFDYYDVVGNYGVRPVFTISTSDIQWQSAPATGIDMGSSLVLSIIGITCICTMWIYLKKKGLVLE